MYPSSRKITVDQSLLKSLLVLATVIEARDPFTGGHIWRTSRYAGMLADALGLTVADSFLCQLGALVHDLGKIAIPDAILKKDGQTTEVEWAAIQKHPEVGFELVSNHPLAALVEKAVAEHHLRPDGKGYPRALSDREPSVISRIVSIADAFDAITSRRPYSLPQSVEYGVQVLRQEAGAQFDEAFVERFCELVRQGRFEHVVGHCADNRMMLSCPECGPIVTTPRSAQDGDTVECPACTSEYVLHFHRDSFDLEFTGTQSGVAVAQPDIEAAEEIAEAAPREIEIDPETSGG